MILEVVASQYSAASSQDEQVNTTKRNEAHNEHVVKEHINLALFFYLNQLIYPINIAAEDNWKSDSTSRADAITYWVAAEPSRFNGIGRRHVALEVGFAPSAP